MGAISTSIELQDNFTEVFHSIIASVNLGLSAMQDMQQAMSASVDMSSIESARECIDQATIAAQQLDTALHGMGGKGAAKAPDPPEPVAWQNSNMEVFTGTGAQRYEQELQSVNQMLGTLGQTQSQIESQAEGMDILPDGAIQDINGIGQRIQALSQQIQVIEGNPLNMGTDAANHELEQLRGKLNQAVQEQQELNAAMEQMDVSAANEAYLRLSSTIGGTERYIRDNFNEQEQFNEAIESGTGNASELVSTLKRAAGAYMTLQSAQAVIGLSDELTQTQARLDMMNDGLQSTQDLQNMIYLSAQRSRGAYQDTADAVSKLGLMAGDAFDSSAEIIAFMEQVNKQFTIAGTEASGIEAAMLQLTQAMGSGVLRGEEYNSILEQAPNIVQNIAKYIEGNEEVLAAVASRMDMEVSELAGNVKGNLKDIAGEGIISAELVKAAMFASADETNAKFEEMPMTFSQVWQSFKNTALIAFQPVLQRINEVANSERFQDMVNAGIEAVALLAEGAVNVFDLLGQAGGWVADNWSWLSPIISGVAMALAVYCIWQAAVNTINLASKVIHFGMAAAQMVHAAATGSLTVAKVAEIAAQNGLNAAMYACPLTWILVLIIALIAVIYLIVAALNKFAGTSISATGVVAGVFATLGAHVINHFVIPLQNKIAMFVNFFGNVFNDPVAAVKVLFYDMALTVMGYIRNLAEGIETLLNKIPGVTVDITSGLDGFYNDLEKAQKKVKDESGWVEYMKKWDYIDYETAWNAGYSFGEKIEDSIAEFDPSKLFDDPTDKLPNPDDYKNPGGYEPQGIPEIPGNVDDIADDTSDIKDSIDITEEDLKYLRDLAEQETVNRFTTAEITIEQTNNNSFSSEMDLDGVVGGLTDAVNEAVEIITEGVHT
ncbi:MAG: tape measure protein [Lachnospiraceae bacterium]|nr:tape measure protein [Lachnospiraceae bacterium]